MVSDKRIFIFIFLEHQSGWSWSVNENTHNSRAIWYICINFFLLIHYYISETIFAPPSPTVLMPQLHLPWVSYDLFVFDFRYDFSGIVCGSNLRRMYLHSLQSPSHFFRRQTGAVLSETFRDRKKTPQSSCSNCVIFTTSHKNYDDRSMSFSGSLRLSQEHQIIFGPMTI